jgi:polyhydroxybutyrate depolymerase
MRSWTDLYKLLGAGTFVLILWVLPIPFSLVEAKMDSHLSPLNKSSFPSKNKEKFATRGSKRLHSPKILKKNITQKWFKKQTQLFSFWVDGVEREFGVYVPENFDPSVKYSLVLMLHGAKEPRLLAEIETGFNEIAEKEQFIVVYPVAKNQQWNDGRLPTDTPSSAVDDVHFLDTLIQYMIQTYPIRSESVFVTGFSSGGMMSQRLAIELPGKIAAIAPVAASIPVPYLEKITHLTPPIPAGGIPVMMINGTADIAFPWDGGKTSIIGIEVGEVAPIQSMVDFWVNYNGGGNLTHGVEECQHEEETVKGVEAFYYPTQSHHCVVLYKVQDGGHTWPGGKIPLSTIPFLGKKSVTLNASELIWTFFKKSSVHPLPANPI